MSEIRKVREDFKSTELIWDIRNFDNAGVGIESQEFWTLGEHGVDHSSVNIMSVGWRLRLQRSPRHEYVVITLQNKSDSVVSVTFDVIFTHRFLRTRTAFDRKGFRARLAKNDSCPLELFIEDFHLQNFEIFCRISDLTVQNTEREDDGASNLAVQYENLLESGELSDVTFNIGAKSIHLHKAILASGSDVFRAMFAVEMKEKKENVVDVVDLDFDVMKEMFRFIYARKVNGIEEMVAELFVVADRYAVEDLKKLSENKFTDQLQVDNVLSRFELSMKYGLVNLKAKVLDFVVRNMQELVGRREFKEMSSDCKDELLVYIAMNRITDAGP